MIGHDPTSLLAMTEFDDVDCCLIERTLEQVVDGDCVSQDKETLALASAGDDAKATLPPPLRRPVSGRYRASHGAVRLELRIDVDGVRPQRKVSGDFFFVSGATVTYVGSFIVDAPALFVSPTNVRIRGSGRFSFAAGAPFVDVTIARVSPLQPPGVAVVRFSAGPGGPGPSYTALYESRFFRTFSLETDRASDVTSASFDHYDTGTLPCGGPRRTLSVVSGFAEAGIEMVPTSAADLVNIGAAGANAQWSDAELHAAMLTHFSMIRNSPYPAVWLFEARDHELGAGLLGIMFDQIGLQRQGCAVFHRGLGGDGAERKRLQLQTYIHELGHCFNLLHSWQKAFANPPANNRPDALSWMNYPWAYPGGESLFWSRFPFQFDNGELVHLRHGFRNNVLMGGSEFTAGAGLTSPEIMHEPMSDESGLIFEIIGVHTSFALGEPVVLKLGLRAATQVKRRVHANIHPNASLSTIIISKPNGQVVAYEPYIDHLFAGNVEEVGGRPIECSAYIGYGRDGHYFDQPGTYKVRAVYHALDGSRVFSNVATIRVRYPASPEDEEVAALMLGEEQGALLYLRGSDSDHLKRGNDAFDKLIAKYAGHVVADYVRFVKGENAARAFKSVDPSAPRRIRVREPDLALAKDCIGKATKQQSRLDDISKREALGRLNVAGSESESTRGKETRGNHPPASA